MTSAKLLIKPSFRDVESGLIPRPESIHVQSTLLKGKEFKLGILLTSDWRVDYEDEQVIYSSGHLVIQSEKIPIPAMSVPDRHRRAVRQVAGAIFNVERFYGLVLYKEPPDGILFYVPWLNPSVNPLSSERHKLFISKRDAVLWCQLNPESGASSEDIEPMKIGRARIRFFPDRSNHAVKQLAQQTSEAVSTELLRLLLQTVTGLAALERLKTLKQRGVSLDILEKAWQKYKQDALPERLRQSLERTD